MSQQAEFTKTNELSSPYASVPLRPNQLVELIQAPELRLCEQGGIPTGLSQVLPHALLPQLLQQVLHLQNCLQSLALCLLPLQLLPSCRLFHRFLELQNNFLKIIIGQNKLKIYAEVKTRLILLSPAAEILHCISGFRLDGGSESECRC